MKYDAIQKPRNYNHTTICPITGRIVASYSRQPTRAEIERLAKEMTMKKFTMHTYWEREHDAPYPAAIRCYDATEKEPPRNPGLEIYEVEAENVAYARSQARRLRAIAEGMLENGSA